MNKEENLKKVIVKENDIEMLKRNLSQNTKQVNKRNSSDQNNRKNKNNNFVSQEDTADFKNKVEDVVYTVFDKEDDILEELESTLKDNPRLLLRLRELFEKK